MKNVALAVSIYIALAGAAAGQSVPVFQDGQVQPNDVSKFERNGLVRGGAGVAGDNNGAGLTPFAVTDFGQRGVCSNSALTTGPYNQVCLGHTAAGVPNLTIDSLNGALPQNHLNLTINGVTTQLPPSASTPSTPVTPQDFGAKCDGIADDGPVFNTAAAATNQLLLPAGSNCKIVTPVVLTKFPFEMRGQDAWPTTGSGIVPGVKASQITCATGATDCISTATTAAQKPGIRMEGIVFDGAAMTGGNILGLYNPTKSSFSRLTMNNVWNGVRVEGPNDNTTTFDQLMIQECRGEQAVLWTNGQMSNFSVVLTIKDSNIACLSASDGVVMDGNIQTLRMANVSIIDSGKELWMRNTVGSTVCPGYVFLDGVEFNGGPHTENFLKADCGYSVQMVNGWSYGATSGDGFAFNKHTAPSVTGSNILMIANSELLGNQVAGRCMFLDWNHISITNTMIGGCAGDVLQSGANTQRTIVTGGIIVNSPNAANYCVSSTAAGPQNSLFLSGTMVAGGCTLGNFNDPGSSIVLTGVIGGPPLKPMTAISGCGTGCTVAIFSGNQAVGTILMHSGTTPAASGVFTLNFTVPLTPQPLCVAAPRIGGSGVWNPLASLQMEPGTGASAIIHWFTNSAALTAGQDYYIDFRCIGLA